MSSTGSNVFDDLKAEMQETGQSLKQLMEDARSDDSSRGDLKRELKAEAESTGQTLKGLIDAVQQRAEENDRDVIDQLKEEFESFWSN